MAGLNVVPALPLNGHDGVMNHVSIGRDFAFDVVELFERTQDFDDRVRWDDHVAALEFVGPITTLQTGALVDVVDPKGGRMHTRYTDVTVGSRIEVEMIGPHNLFDSFTGSWTYGAVATGARLTIDYRFTLRKPWSLISPLVRGATQRRTRDKLAMLDRHLSRPTQL